MNRSTHNIPIQTYLNILDNYLSKFTVTEWYVYTLLLKDTIKEINKDNIFISCKVDLDIRELPNNLKIKFSKGFTSLKKKNLIRRISKNKYMINPDLLYPTFYEAELYEWSNLKENK